MSYDEDRIRDRELNEYLDKQYGEDDLGDKDPDPDFYREEGEC